MLQWNISCKSCKEGISQTQTAQRLQMNHSPEFQI